VKITIIGQLRERFEKRTFTGEELRDAYKEFGGAWHGHQTVYTMTWDLPMKLVENHAPRKSPYSEKNVFKLGPMPEKTKTVHSSWHHPLWDNF